MQDIALDAANGALAGIIYGLLWFARQRSKDSARGDGEFESFDPYKLGSTVLIGAVLGAALSSSGAPLDQAAFEQQLAGYAGAIALIEAILKGVADRAGVDVPV